MGDETFFAMLGPFDVRVNGRHLPIRSAKTRALLAALLLRPGRLVPFDELARVVWGDRQPSNPRRAVQVKVSRIRILFGEAGFECRIATDPHGYRLDVPAEWVDVSLFQQRLRQADAARADPERELQALELALGQWRGDPLEDVPSDLLHTLYVPELMEQRLAGEERRMDACLRLGRYAEILPDLARLTSAYPLREKLSTQLVTALHRGGRRAEALEVYQRTRRVLAEELGLDPGEELRQLHGEVLNGNPVEAGGSVALPVVPRQLPGEMSSFAGRAPQVAVLHASLTGQETDSAPVTVVIAGMAGVGKTTLAVHWSRRVADHFPDGQLWIDLHGYDPGARVSPHDALARFLRALGLQPDDIPADTDGRTELFRSLVDGRRMLVVLDNADTDEQVRPLLPSGPGSLAVVTSRSHLLGLVAAGARTVPLGVFTDAEAQDMLGRRLGADRVRVEAPAVAEIIRLCAGLPLALGVVAARAATRPEFALSALARELADSHHRLDVLSGRDATADVRSVLSWSYRAVTPPAARLFRLLGLHPGPDFAVRAVASLAGVPLGQCRILLAELVDAHLVEERVLDRYAVHDLIRAYAVEMVRAHDTDRDRREAELRLLDHYLHTAYAASRLLYQHEEPIPVGAARDGVVPVPCRDYGEAMAWFTAERAVLLSMVAFAARPDFADYPWQLAWSLVEFLDRQGHWQDWVTSHRTALSAADRLDNPQAQARTRLFLARAYNRLGFSAQAEVELDVALRLYRTTGSTTGEATTHLALSASAERRSDLHGSLAHDRAAYELFRRAGHLAGQAEALNACGWDLVQLGDYQHAVEHCEQALQLCQHLDEPHGAAATWDTLGYAHFHLGDHRRAIACYEQALRLYRQLDDRYNIGDVLVHLGEARHQDGQIDAARIAWNEALALLETLRPSAADDVRIKLKAVQHD